MFRRFSVSRTLIVIILTGLGNLATTAACEAANTLQVFADGEYSWLRSVGKLQVPGQRYEGGSKSYYVEDCSATLVAQTSENRANTIITAWHCLEFYGDLSKPITFTLTTLAGEKLQREAYRLADGGSMHGDWAILRLRRPIPSSEVAPLTIHPASANPGWPVTMAGYSNNTRNHAGRKTLSYDPACRITRQDRDLGDTDCTAYKGASGGAVIQLSNSGIPRVCGVISQGNGEGRSTFVPVSRFRNAINLHLR
jgi:hypothetical protein